MAPETIQRQLSASRTGEAPATRLSAWQRTWMTAVITVWVVCAVLSGLQAAFFGWPAAWMYTTYPGPDAYPEILTQGGFRFSPPEAAFRPGDLLVAIDKFDLRGLGGPRLVSCWYPAGEGKLWERSRYEGARHPIMGLTVAVRYLRGGDLQTVTTSIPADRYNRLRWLLGFFGGAIAVFVGLRARASPGARAYLLVGVVSGLWGSRFFLGSWELLFVNWVISTIGYCCIGGVMLRWVLLMPDEAAPKARWPYWAVWIYLPAAVMAAIDVGLIGGEFGYLDERLIAEIVTATIIALSVPAILVRNYRASGPLGRRQLKWLLLAVSVAGITWAAVYLTALFRADWLRAFSHFITPLRYSVFLLVPIATAIAILRFNLYDIDRLMSGTASYTILVILLALGGELLFEPLAARAAFSVGLDPSVGQVAFVVVIAAVLIPAQRVWRPYLDRIFFAEGQSVGTSVEEILERLSHATGVGAVMQQTGAVIERAFRPEFCVIYEYAGKFFEPRYVVGSGEFTSIPADEQSVLTLETKVTAVRLDSRGTTPSSADRIDWLVPGAAVILPLRSQGAPNAFVAIGPKRSGDVYTSTDLSLLSAVAYAASAQHMDSQSTGVHTAGNG